MSLRGLISTHADFRYLWIGDGVSKLGSQVVVLVMPVLAATTLDASTWQVGLLTTFAGLPFLLIGLPVGAWSDRVRRRPLLVAADLGRAAVLAWVPIGYVLEVLTIEQLYVVQLLVGVGTVFFDVSQGASVSRSSARPLCTPLRPSSACQQGMRSRCCSCSARSGSHRAPSACSCPSPDWAQ